jgi:hypothetical protein
MGGREPIHFPDNLVSPLLLSPFDLSVNSAPNSS